VPAGLLFVLQFIDMDKRPGKMMRRLAVAGIRLVERSPQGELSLAEDVSEDVPS